MSINKAMEELAKSHGNEGLLEKINRNARLFFFLRLGSEALSDVINNDNTQAEINKFCLEQNITIEVFFNTFLPIFNSMLSESAQEASEQLPSELKRLSNVNWLEKLAKNKEQEKICENLYDNDEKWQKHLRMVSINQLEIIFEKIVIKNKFDLRKDAEIKKILKKVFYDFFKRLSERIIDYVNLSEGGIKVAIFADPPGARDSSGIPDIPFYPGKMPQA